MLTLVGLSDPSHSACPCLQGTVIWRARRQWSPGCVNREQSCFFQSLTGLALAFPIVGDNVVWTMSAPVQVWSLRRLFRRTSLRAS